MGLLETAREDILEITSDLDGWGVSIILTAPTLETFTFNGLHTKHHIAITPEGKQVNTKNSHISFAEVLAVEVGYPLRDLKGEVNLKDHRVDVVDSTGATCAYVVREWFPDETVGLIVCILGDFE